MTIRDEVHSPFVFPSSFRPYDIGLSPSSASFRLVFLTSCLTCLSPVSLRQSAGVQSCSVFTPPRAVAITQICAKLRYSVRQHMEAKSTFIYVDNNDEALQRHLPVSSTGHTWPKSRDAATVCNESETLIKPLGSSLTRTSSIVAASASTHALRNLSERI